MKNIVRIVSIMTLLVLGAFSSAGTQGYRLKKIVIDAGHGGRDPGASGNFSKEKNVALQIALKLGKLIKKDQNMKGVDVIYTRQEDKFVTLHDRAQIANKNNADVFISIHCNAAPKGEVAYGTETYTMGLHTSKSNLEVAKKENAVILLEKDYQKKYDLKSPELHIMQALHQSVYNKNSVRLAHNIQYQFKNRVKRRNRGVRQAGLLVLWKTTTPSVLVEVGFITHTEEEKYLNSKKGQTHIADGILAALLDYKKQLEAT